MTTMCATCPCNSVSSIPGPGDVAGALLGVAADSVGFKVSRKVVFFGVGLPLLPFAVWGLFGWWTIALVVLAAVVAAGTFTATRILHRGHMVAVRPEPTPEMRAALAARGLKPIPAAGQARRAQPALPRAVRHERAWAQFTATVTGTRPAGPQQALPAPAKALPAAVVTGRVIEEPAIGWENAPAAYKRQVSGRAPRAGR